MLVLVHLFLQRYRDSISQCAHFKLVGLLLLLKVFECLLTFYPDLRQQHSAGRSAPIGLWHLWQCHMPTESPDTDSDGWQPHSEEESWK